MQIRFDDLRPGHRRGFGFDDPMEVIASNSVGEGADDVVLVNGSGRATETTRASLAVRFVVEDGCLSGTYRA